MSYSPINHLSDLHAQLLLTRYILIYSTDTNTCLSHLTSIIATSQRLVLNFDTNLNAGTSDRDFEKLLQLAVHVADARQLLIKFRSNQSGIALPNF